MEDKSYVSQQDAVSSRLDNPSPRGEYTMCTIPMLSHETAEDDW